jgi:hypothetical protein
VGLCWRYKITKRGGNFLGVDIEGGGSLIVGAQGFMIQPEKGGSTTYVGREFWFKITK